MLNIIPWDVVFILINLIVLYVIMRIVLVKPIKSVIEKRESIIKSGLKNAAESEASAKALEEEWHEKIGTAKEKSEEMIEKAKADAQSEYDKLVAEANTEAARIVSDARRGMEEEKRNTMQGIRSEVAGLAIDTARKVLENSDLSGIDNSLYDKFLTETGDGNDTDGK